LMQFFFFGRPAAGTDLYRDGGISLV